MKTVKLAILVVMPMLLPAASNAQESASARSDFDAVEAIDICQSLFADSSATKAEMLRSGWSVPKGKISPVYKEADAAALEKGNISVIFIGPESSIAAIEDDFPGSCQIVAPGNNILAATALAAHFKQAAVKFRPENGRVYSSVAFVIDGAIIETASLNKENSAFRLQYVPEQNLKPAAFSPAP